MMPIEARTLALTRGPPTPPTKHPAEATATAHLLPLRAHDAGEALHHLGRAMLLDHVLLSLQVGL